MPVEFVASAPSREQFPKDGLPEVAFVGRSNVGKSSLLNTLLLRGKQSGSGAASLNQKQLARTSRTPGRTRTLNFFRVNGAFYFVDLPGYGYAKVSKTEMIKWRALAESYLLDRSTLRLVVLIIDSRQGATPLDHQMKDWLSAKNVRFLVVASKFDKVKASERTKTVRSVEQDFHPPLPFSAKSGEGVGPLWQSIRDAVAPQP